LQVM